MLDYETPSPRLTWRKRSHSLSSRLVFTLVLPSSSLPPSSLLLFPYSLPPSSLPLSSLPPFLPLSLLSLFLLPVFLSRSFCFRMLVFSPHGVKSVSVWLDGHPLPPATKVHNGPLYTTPWNPQEVATGQHTITVAAEVGTVPFLSLSLSCATCTHTQVYLSRTRMQLATITTPPTASPWMALWLLWMYCPRCCS